MPTVRDYFTSEAGEYLGRLERVLEGMDQGTVAPTELHRIGRALRGSAQMAREDAFARVAAALEGVAKGVAEGHVRWAGDLSGRLHQTVQDLRELLRLEPDDVGDRADAATARLAGVAPAAGAPGAPPGPGDHAEIAFREFATRETAAVLATTEAALKGLALNPADREPLKAVLRRQRALMGAARLSEIPILAETLAAVDEITRMVARLDVAVTGEWVEVYRSARDVLTALVGSLQRGLDGPPPPALALLRSLRQQLVERYGADEPMREPPVFAPGDDVAAGVVQEVRPSTAAPASPPRPFRPPPPAAAVPPAATPRPVAPPPPPPPPPPPTAAPRPVAAPPRPAIAPPPAAGPVPTAAPPPASAPAQGGAVAGAQEVLPIEQFLYHGAAALRRAAELRPALEQAVGRDDALTMELLEELFDLITAAGA